MPKQTGEFGRNWYVLHTYSGYEDAVAHNLRQRIESLDMKDKIFKYSLINAVEHGGKSDIQAVLGKLIAEDSSVKEKIPEPLIEREDFEREEHEGKKSDIDFRRRMFENAPKKNDDFIIGEKKGW